MGMRRKRGSGAIYFDACVYVAHLRQERKEGRQTEEAKASPGRVTIRWSESAPSPRFSEGCFAFVGRGFIGADRSAYR